MNAELGLEDVLGFGLQLFNQITSDDQDSVRLLAVDVMIAIAKLLSIEQRTEHLLPAFQALASDKSWRVKYMVASEYVEVIRNEKRHKENGLCTSHKGNGWLFG